jgi:hypothetical protein
VGVVVGGEGCAVVLRVAVGRLAVGEGEACTVDSTSPQAAAEAVSKTAVNATNTRPMLFLGPPRSVTAIQSERYGRAY